MWRRRGRSGIASRAVGGRNVAFKEIMLKSDKKDRVQRLGINFQCSFQKSGCFHFALLIIIKNELILTC